jgi:hypothetical protein
VTAVACLHIAPDLGNSDAQWRPGRLLCDGDILAKDESAVAALFDASTAAANPTGQVCPANALPTGTGAPRPRRGRFPSSELRHPPPIGPGFSALETAFVVALDVTATLSLGSAFCDRLRIPAILMSPISLSNYFSTVFALPLGSFVFLVNHLHINSTSPMRVIRPESNRRTDEGSCQDRRIYELLGCPAIHFDQLSVDFVSSQHPHRENNLFPSIYILVIYNKNHHQVPMQIRSKVISGS